MKVSNSICRACSIGSRARLNAESLSMVSRTATSKAPRDRRTFGDKRSLFIRALQTYDARFRGELLEELEREFAPLDAIERLLRVFVDRLGQPGQVPGCFLTNTALELAIHDVEIGRIVAHAQEQVQAFFARLIARGQARGEIGPHVNAAPTAAALLASLIGLAVLARSRPDPALLNGIIDQAMASVRGRP